MLNRTSLVLLVSAVFLYACSGRFGFLASVANAALVSAVLLEGALHLRGRERVREAVAARRAGRQRR